MNQTQRKYIIDRINELVNDKKCQLLNEARQKLDVPFEKEVAEINQRIEKLKKVGILESFIKNLQEIK